MSLKKSIIKIIVQNFILMLLITTGAKAGTTGKISGKIVDYQSKEALIGVNILIEGTSIGGATDVDGFYFSNYHSVQP